VAVATRSKAWVCGRSLAGIAFFEYRRGHGCLSLVCVVCCQVEGPLIRADHSSRGFLTSVILKTQYGGDPDILRSLTP